MSALTISGIAASLMVCPPPHLNNATSQKGCANFELMSGRKAASCLRIIVREAEGGGSCCGGKGKRGSSRECSPDVSGVGPEFERLLGSLSMKEVEKDYDTSEMQGTITREVLQDVMNAVPQTLAAESGENVLDVEKLLAEAKTIARGDFIFDASMEDLFV